MASTDRIRCVSKSSRDAGLLYNVPCCIYFSDRDLYTRGEYHDQVDQKLCHRNRVHRSIVSSIHTPVASADAPGNVDLGLTMISFSKDELFGARTLGYLFGGADETS